MIVCKCAENAVLLTVRKEGPNTGRQFYKCPKPQGGGSCDFFLWADASNTNTPAPAPYSRGAENANNRQPAFQNEQRDDNSEVCCNCGEPGKLLTVNKDGPNHGRPFYGCAKPRDAQCGFFQWADDNGGGGARGGGFGQNSNDRFNGGARHDGGGSRGRGRGRGRGRANESSSNERRTRKCGSCGQEGNTRIEYYSPKLWINLLANFEHRTYQESVPRVGLI